MRTNKKLGIYVHIPFCNVKCSYCDFYSVTNKQEKRYVTEISKHIKEYGSVSKNYEVDTIYIGGGTPSCIPHNLLTQIIKQINKNFQISKNLEITVELNPESTDIKMLKALKKSGVTRISIGIQSSNDEKLLELGRIHTFERAKECVETAKKVGFDNISVDLMYGLIGQTLDQLKKDVENFLKLDVDHISTYALKIEEATPLFLQNAIPLDDDLVADMYDYICEKLGENKYKHYEISNFCRHNKRSFHNMKYWNLDEYIGIGPSAHSFFVNARFGYVKDLEEYILHQTIEEREEDAPLEARFGEYIMLKLRTIDGINTDEFFRIFSKDFNDYMPRCKKFIESGYATYKNGVFSLTEKGFIISNHIISEIIKE